MKLKKFFALVMSIVCVATLCAPASAVEDRASAQIAVYEMRAVPASGYIAVYASVTGSGRMNKLGCESIYVYKLVNGSWVSLPGQTKLEDDTGMSLTNAYDYVNSFHCDSEAGETYKVVVTIFAENVKGRDSRSDTFYVTGK